MDYKKNLPGETMYDKAYTDAEREEKENAAAEGASAQNAETVQDMGTNDASASETTSATSAEGSTGGHAGTAAQADNAAQAEPRAAVYDVPPQARPTAQTAEKPAPNLKRQFAIASMVLGICSPVILFAIPLIGIVPAAVGSVFSLVFGIYSHKEYPGFCWSGIILSIITLVLALLMVILGCIVGWSMILYFANYAQDSFPNFYRGFYY